MLRPIFSVVGVALVGCGFQSSASIAADAGADGATASDARLIDAPPVTGTCLDRWREGTVKLSNPTALPKQSTTNAAERDPWVSADGLRMYYTVDPPGSERADLMYATRASVTEAFGEGAAIPNLDTNSDESRAALSADEKMMVLSSNRDDNASFAFYYVASSTANVFASPNKDHMGMVNALPGQHYDPFLSGDGLRLYFAPVPDNDKQHLWFSSRATTASDFLAPVKMAGVNSASDYDADPVLSPDELVLLFSSDRAAGAGLDDNNLWYATRTSALSTFGAPKLVPTVNGNEQDGDPHLSADGCTLYFASNRGSGNTYDIYVSTMQPE